MNKKQDMPDLVRRQTIIASALLCLLAGMSRAESTTMKIYVPRSIKVHSGMDVKLGGIVVIQGDDTELVAQASEIAMGRCPTPGESIILDRRAILSRLVANGISSKRVEFSGTDAVAVTRNEKVMQPAVVEKAARTYLDKLRPLPKGGRYELSGTPGAWVLPNADQHVKLRPRLVSETQTEAIVDVAALAGSDELATRRLRFKVHMPRYETLALREILPGEILSPENAEIRISTSDRAADPNWRHPFGLVSGASIAQGSVIHPHVLKEPQPATMVRRNQSVVMKFTRPGFMISAVGIALQDGKVGELIRVQNADTRRIVTARVESDGTVEPVVEERS